MKALHQDYSVDHESAFPMAEEAASPIARKVMRKAAGAPAGGQEVEPAGASSGFFDAINAGLVSRAAEGSGHSLPDDLRGRFEQSLGTDLSGVRVHTDSAAAAASSALDARAYAVGQDVYMGAGQYNPSTPDGAFLLAHEVAHTVQQRGASSGPQCKLEVSEPGDAMETDADAAAEAMILGQPTTVARMGATAARKIMRFGSGEYRTVRNVSFGDALFGDASSRIGYNGYLERYLSEQGMIGGSQFIGPNTTTPIHIHHGQPGAFRVRLVLGYEIDRRMRGSLNGSAELVAAVDYHFNADGTTTFEVHGTDDSSGIISGSQPAGMQIRRRITVPTTATGPGPHRVNLGWMFDGGTRSGATAAFTPPHVSAQAEGVTLNGPTATITSGQRTTANERETADYGFSVFVDGIPAPAPPPPPPPPPQPIVVINNSLSNSNDDHSQTTNNNTSNGGAGGAGGNGAPVNVNVSPQITGGSNTAHGGGGGAGGTATANGGTNTANGGASTANGGTNTANGGAGGTGNGGSASANATGGNATANSQASASSASASNSHAQGGGGHRPGPDPQTTPAPAPPGSLPSGDHIHFERGSSSASADAQVDVGVWVAGLRGNTELLDAIRAGTVRLRVEGSASPVGDPEMNQRLSRHRARTAMSILTHMFQRMHHITPLFTHDTPVATGESGSADGENEADAQAQAATWSLEQAPAP